MTEIKTGMLVRSFDFAGTDLETGGRDLEGQRACYVDGTLVAILPVGHHLNPNPSCEAYQIHVERRIFGGEDITNDQPNVGTYVYPPVNGTHSLLGGTTDGVVPIILAETTWAEQMWAEMLRQGWTYDGNGFMVSPDQNRYLPVPKGERAAIRKLTPRVTS